MMAILLVVVGCKSSTPTETNPGSAIVVEAEAAGAGNLSGVAESSVEVWMGTHVDLARKLTPQCNDRMKKGFDAAWMQSEEGIVCTAAARVAYRDRFFSSHDDYNGNYAAPARK